jgi:hypothetical protein
MTATDALRFRRTTRAVHVVVLQGGALAWDADARALHRFNTAAAFVLDACTQWRTPAEIATLARAEATVEADVDDDEIARCLDELRTLGLVETKAAAS